MAVKGLKTNDKKKATYFVKVHKRYEIVDSLDINGLYFTRFQIAHASIFIIPGNSPVPSTLFFADVNKNL